jgi:hypothetical protein
MSTKTVKSSRPGGPKPPAGKRPPKGGPRPAAARKPEPFAEEDDGRPVSFVRHTLVPSIACGILAGVIALEEGAKVPVAALVAVCIAGVIAGMVKLKNSLFGG